MSALTSAPYQPPRSTQGPCTGRPTLRHPDPQTNPPSLAGMFTLYQGAVVSLPNTETAVQPDDLTSSKDGVQRRTNVRWKMFLLLLVLVSVNYIDRGSISVALPIIQKEFNMAPELVGLLLSAFFWTYALMQIPVGLLIDKFGPRKVVTASCLG